MYFKGLAPARELIQRIRKRKLYKFVDEVAIPAAMIAHLPKVTPEDITTCQIGTGKDTLHPDDLIIQDLKINYAMKDRNPVDNTHFFSSARDRKPFLIPKSKVSSLIPDQFQEKFIRVFVKDATKVGAAQRAFNRWARKQGLVDVSGTTSVVVSATTSASTLPEVAPSDQLFSAEEPASKRSRV